MNTELNKQLVRRYWEEVWNQGNLALILEMFGSDRGEGEHNYVSRALSAFTESVLTIEDMIAEGDKVVARYRWNAVHSAVWDWELDGVSMAVPPTNKQVSTTGIIISRVADGKIVEQWVEWTALKLAQQLGAVPGPTRTDDQTEART